MIERYTEYFELEAVGQRIGLTSCRKCGAVVLIGDRDFDAVARHDEWHAARTTPAESAPAVPLGEESR